MASTDVVKEKIITLKLALQILGVVLLSVVFLVISALLTFVPHSYFIANANAFSYAFIALAVANCGVTALFIYKKRTLGLIYMFACAFGLIIIEQSSSYGISTPETGVYFGFMILAAFYVWLKNKPAPVDIP
jgi:hypothetical protein